MVDLADRVEKIGKLVDEGRYFTISRARQYGKTTTLNALETALSSQYDVVSLDFQDITSADFENEHEFVRGLAQMICDARDSMNIPLPGRFLEQFRDLWENSRKAKLSDLFRIFDQWCRENEKRIVLMIDEIDTATGKQVFLDFLGKLRSNYLKREKNLQFMTFQSVILAGVADIRQLESMNRSDDMRRFNSPWNIAADFDIDMGLSESGIRVMLEEYESDHGTRMDLAAIAKSVWDYTSGYPFLVSRICQLVDEVVSEKFGLKDAWTIRGVDEAAKQLLDENNTLFQSLTRNLNNYPKLKAAIRSILMEGTRLTWNPDQEDLAQMKMYGHIRNDGNTVVVANRIFETRLYNFFLSDDELKSNVFCREGAMSRNVCVSDGKLNMPLVLERFVQTYHQVCGPLEERFREQDGRELFLLFLKPVINGAGNYYIEAQTRNQTRTDVIVDYQGQKYVIELKIWRGERYNAEGEKQICEYLEYWNLNTGYMLSFNFNQKKKIGVQLAHVGGKLIYEAVV